MQGKWKENLKGYNSKGSFRKKTTFKNRRKDKKRILRRFDVYDDEVEFYRPNKRIVNIYKAKDYGCLKPIYSLNFNDKEYLFYQKENFLYCNSVTNDKTIENSFFGFSWVELTSKKKGYKALKIPKHTFAYYFHNDAIKLNNFHRIKDTIENNISNKEYYLGKLLEDYEYSMYYPIGSRKFCQKFSNKKERLSQKRFCYKISKDIDVFEGSFEDDFDCRKSIAWCVS